MVNKLKKKEKKKRGFLSSFSICFLVVILAALLSWIIPAGNYDYIHPKVLLAYYGSNPITITLMYGSVENAQALISRLEKCFNDPSEDRRVESALEVYRYTWSRYAQGKMTPAQVKDSLQRILHYRKRELNRCIDIALEYIDERRKPMSERKPRQNPFEIWYSLKTLCRARHKSFTLKALPKLLEIRQYICGVLANPL